MTKRAPRLRAAYGSTYVRQYVSMAVRHVGWLAGRLASPQTGPSSESACQISRWARRRRPVTGVHGGAVRWSRASKARSSEEILIRDLALAARAAERLDPPADRLDETSLPATDRGFGGDNLREGDAGPTRPLRQRRRDVAAVCVCLQAQVLEAPALLGRPWSVAATCDSATSSLPHWS
jgi:hypothetical protein